MTGDDTRARLAEFLAAQSTLSLATLGAGGQPESASLFFAADTDLRLYWLSSGHSRHSQNLARQPAVAVTIHNQTWSWTEITGVQMQGPAVLVPAGEAWHAAWSLYLAKFSFASQMEAEVRKSNFYVLTADWIRLIDNRLGFGHKEEIGNLK
jgi:uncharacterized protein YhbP (UPF0306 family)